MLFYCGCRFHFLGLHFHDQDSHHEEDDHALEKNIDWTKVSNKSEATSSESFEYVPLPKEAADALYPPKTDQSNPSADGDLLNDNNNSFGDFDGEEDKKLN